MGGAGGSRATPLSPSGSFDLRVSAVSVTLPTGPAAKAPPAQGLALRIDLPPAPSQKGSPWKAIVTERWGLPTTFTVREDGGALVLEGSLAVVRTSDSVADILQSFRLLRDRQGRLNGAVSVRGQENVFAGEQGFTGELAATGALTVDTTAPEARVLPRVSLAPVDAIFPWDLLGVEFAEPVGAVGALNALRLTDEGGAALVATGVTAPSGEDAKSGISRAYASFPTWDGLPPRVMLTAGAGYADAVGNGGSVVTAAYDLVALTPPKLAREGFDLKDASFALFGAAVRVGLAVPDPLCETSGCVDLGSFENSLCGVLPSGVAGRLTVPGGAKTVSFRLRVLLGSGVPGGTASTVKGASPVSVQLVRPGGEPVLKDIGAPTSQKDGGGGAGGKSASELGTAWTTVSLPLPEGAGELGFALRAGSHFAGVACDPAQPSLTLPLRVLVDSIAVE